MIVSIHPEEGLKFCTKLVTIHIENSQGEVLKSASSASTFEPSIIRLRNNSLDLPKFPLGPPEVPNMDGLFIHHGGRAINHNELIAARFPK